MKKIPFQSNINFADAQYRYFQINEKQDLTIFITSWDEREIQIELFNILSFSFSRGSIIQDLFEIFGDKYFEDAMKCYYEERPLNTLFKHYQLVDIDDFPFIEMVAEGIQVVKSCKITPFRNLK